jgi:hypothetical protein
LRIFWINRDCVFETVFPLERPKFILTVPITEVFAMKTNVIKEGASISPISWILGLVVIASLVACKIFQTAGIFLLVVFFTAIFYQRETNKKKNRTANFEETLINISKFIIITGVSGVFIVKILALFFQGLE